ncbi:MAG: OsmC family protein [Anaerolineales bacterium]
MKIKSQDPEAPGSSSTVNLHWINSTDTLMVGVDSRGTSTVMGIWDDQETQWKGLKASDLLLLSAAACSAYDVVTILKKKREPLENLEVICKGELQTDPPKKFTHIHLHYSLKGAVSDENVREAIKLSEEKYCTVINTLKGSVEVTSDFEIHE